MPAERITLTACVKTAELTPTGVIIRYAPLVSVALGEKSHLISRLTQTLLEYRRMSLIGLIRVRVVICKIYRKLFYKRELMAMKVLIDYA